MKNLYLTLGTLLAFCLAWATPTHAASIWQQATPVNLNTTISGNLVGQTNKISNYTRFGAYFGGPERLYKFTNTEPVFIQWPNNLASQQGPNSYVVLFMWDSSTTTAANFYSTWATAIAPGTHYFAIEAFQDRYGTGTFNFQLTTVTTPVPPAEYSPVATRLTLNSNITHSIVAGPSRLNNYVMSPEVEKWRNSYRVGEFPRHIGPESVFKFTVQDCTYVEFRTEGQDVSLVMSLDSNNFSGLQAGRVISRRVPAGTHYLYAESGSAGGATFTLFTRSSATPIPRYQNAAAVATTIPTNNSLVGTLANRGSSLYYYGDDQPENGKEAVYRMDNATERSYMFSNRATGHHMYLLDSTGSTANVLLRNLTGFSGSPWESQNAGDPIAPASPTFDGTGKTTLRGRNYLSVEQGAASQTATYNVNAYPACIPTLDSWTYGNTMDLMLNNVQGVPYDQDDWWSYSPFRVKSYHYPLHNQAMNSFYHIGNSGFNNIRLFVDFNQDGDFDDTHELIYTNSSNLNQVIDNFALTPNNPVYLAAGGKTLRARLTSSPNVLTGSPCGTMTNTSVLDFLVDVLNDNVAAANTDFTWVRTANSYSPDAYTGVSTAPDGNLYAVGNYGSYGESQRPLLITGLPGESRRLLNSNPNSAYSQQKGVITRYDRNGSLKWASEISADQFVEVNAVTTDRFGYAYVAGSFRGTMTFYPSNGAGQTLTSYQGTQDGYVAKYHPDGRLVFAFKFGGTGSERASDIGVAPDLRFYVGGSFVSSITMQGISGTQIALRSRGNSDAFLAKFSDLGSLYWLIQAGGTGNDFAYGVAADKTGGGYLLGSYEGTATFNSSLGGVTPISKTAVGGSDAFVLGVNVTGNLGWVTSMGGSTNEALSDLAPDPRGTGVVAVGGYSGTAYFGSLGERKAKGFYDAFAVRLSNTGAFEWVSTAGGFGQDRAHGVRLDRNGNAWVTFSYGAPLITLWGANSTLAPRGETDGAVTRLNAANGLMATGAPFGAVAGGQSEFAYGVDTVDNGSVVFTGSSGLNAKFGRLGYAYNENFQFGGGQDAYVARFSGTSMAAAVVPGLGDDLHDGVVGAVSLGLAAYPNPSTGQAYVRLTGLTDDAAPAVQVVDAAGRMVLTATPTAQQLNDGYELPEKLNPGIYAIRCGQATARLVVR